METLKQIAFKLCILAIGIIGLNYFYKATLWQKDLNLYSGINKSVKMAQNAEILYLGDCSDSYFGPNSNKEKGIGQLLDSLTPNTRITSISETGFHAGMFAGILNSLPEDNNVKTVIVTMNLRSFSANVLYAFTANATEQRTRMLNSNPPLLNRFLLTFKPTKMHKGIEMKKIVLKKQKKDPIPLAPYNSLHEWRTAFENGTYISFDGSWTAKKKKLAVGHINNYAFQINPKTNPRIADFDNIVLIAKKKKLRLIFHLLPENLSKTKELIGKDLTDIINFNRTFLHKRYASDGVIIIDNMDLLKDVDFIEELPNSHFYYNGRKKMAKIVADFLMDEKLNNKAL